MSSSAKLPFYVAGIQIGTVDNLEEHHAYFRGNLRLDATCDATIRAAFQKAVDLAKRIDVCDPNKYEACWFGWKIACDALEVLSIGIAEPQKLAEQFNIESDWHVEWQKHSFEDAFQ